jgi:hypothetical protein
MACFSEMLVIRTSLQQHHYQGVLDAHSVAKREWVSIQVLWLCGRLRRRMGSQVRLVCHISLRRRYRQWRVLVRRVCTVYICPMLQQRTGHLAAVTLLHRIDL